MRRILGLVALIILLGVGLANYYIDDLDISLLMSILTGGQEESLHLEEGGSTTTNYSRTTSEEIARASCLLDHLPEDVGTFGYMPELPKRMEDPRITHSILRQRDPEYRIYYLTQFALAARVITFYNSHPWIIANYPNHAEGMAAIAERGYSIVEDCGNGVFLVRN